MAHDVKPVVITLHGIRTRGDWQKRIAPRIARYGMIPVLLDYGYFNLFQFLNPWARDGRVKWLRDEVAKVIQDYPCAPISIVAHSLGTYLVARLIEEETTFHFETILFSGSMVRSDYDWSRPLDAFRVQYVANYIARKDIWPRLAQTVVRGAGRAGIDGFKDEHVSLFQHTHPKYGHSDYFNPHVFEKLWLPKLAVPQRQTIENLSVLLVQSTQLLRTTPDTGTCMVRARLFYKARNSTTFRQFPGMHIASAIEAKYADDELDYTITQGVGLGGPPGFQAAFTGMLVEWTAVDHQQPNMGRADVLASVATPIYLPANPSAGVVAMVSLEILADGTYPQLRQAIGVKPLVPRLSQNVATVCVNMQKLFPKEW